ncbi:DUF3306 domain-containing protein [Azoarcus sp. L1K30]|uniref:DUF3306 domain-containing protein n=1 Tax=Azoarcus sp. L1K30 TaxID=2820277 RepID=UPI001B835ABB|nr:DUF3306 domain-containing protein [Azoarcus sp. L1K30]
MSAPGRFLSRWSRLKLTPAAAETPVVANAAVDAPATASGTPAAGIDPSAAPDVLPDIASLALDSDFTAFLKEEVSEGLRRQALKKLFSDPHFNVMDGLDIYIDDYSVSQPIPPELLAKLRSAAEWLGDREGKIDDENDAESGLVETPAALADGAPETQAVSALAPEAGGAPLDTALGKAVPGATDDTLSR